MSKDRLQSTEGQHPFQGALNGILEAADPTIALAVAEKDDLGV